MAALLLFAATAAVAQPKKAVPAAAGNSTAAQVNEVAAKLAQQMKADPKNPLKVDAASLQKLADALPDGNLKSKMLEYSARLNNPDLSYRQLYWDMAQAFDAMPQATKMMQFQETYQSLDVLMNKSKMVANAFKGDLSGLNLNTFTGDPAFMGALTKVTGSSDMAQNIGFTLGVGIELIKGFKEDRERKKKFIADYKRFAELSTAMVYAETDETLSRALIDAQVMKQPAPVNSILRHDFANGARIYAEDGIIKWRSPDGKTTKNICLAEPRNDGALDFDYKTYGRYTDGQLFIGADSMMLVPNTNSKRKCDDCLIQPRTLNVLFNKLENTAAVNISTATGEKGFNPMHAENYKDLKKQVKDAKKQYAEMVKNGNDPVKEMQEQMAKGRPRLPPGSVYKIDGKQIPVDTSYLFVPTFPFLSMSSAVFQGFNITSVTGLEFATSYGTIFYTRNNSTGKFNSDLLHNKVAATFINPKNSDLLVVGTNGALATISAKESDPDAAVRSIAQQLEKKPLLPAWSMHTEKDEAIFEGVGNAAPAGIFAQPRLTMGPDATYVIYQIQDYLGIIPFDDVSKTVYFKMSFKPLSLRFGRENGDNTLYVQGFNEFTFPIVKKYSMKKILAAKHAENVALPGTTAAPREETAASTNSKQTKGTEKATPPAAKKGAQTGKKGTGSLADELKKLRELYDNGTLSKEEFEAAKKKLLEQ